MEDSGNGLRTVALREKLRSTFSADDLNVLPLFSDYIKIVARKSFKYCACCTVGTVLIFLSSIWSMQLNRSTPHSIENPNAVSHPNNKYIKSKPVNVKQNRREIRQIKRDIDQITKILTFTRSSRGLAKTNKAKEVGNVDTRSLATLTVNVDKANLRAKADIDSEAVAEIAAGTQLVLEAVKENWAGVISPWGERAWIRMDLVRVD
jgi:uncharacterized protein YgiM (DUF1202 family)